MCLSGQFLGQLWGQLLGQILGQLWGQLWEITFGDNFCDNFYGPDEKVIVVGYFVPVVETHLSADGRPHWLRMDIPFIDQFSEKTPWSAKSNYPNYFFSLGDHNSKFFFHCLSSHFDYTIKVSLGNYFLTFPTLVILSRFGLSFNRISEVYHIYMTLYLCIVEYLLYDLFLFFLGKTVHHSDAKIPPRKYKAKQKISW